MVKHIYFVAGTKGSMSSMQMRLIEESKICYAREHFKVISNGEVVYDVVDSYQSLAGLGNEVISFSFPIQQKSISLSISEKCFFVCLLL